MIFYLLLFGMIGVTGAVFYFSYHLIGLAHTIAILPQQKILAPTDWPKVSIIVPIHNEALHLVHAITSLCTLNYPCYEVIALDDRSTDNSLLLLDGLQQQYPLLKVIHIPQVPHNWLGKTYALQKGIECASGAYLVFTDADVIFSSLTLQHAISFMHKHQLEHLTLAPRLIIKNILLRWFMPFHLFMMLLATMPWKMHDKNPRNALGVGAFNCVTRKALKKINGFYSLALNPIDDVGLARLLKSAGIKQGFANPHHLVQLEWYGSICDVIKGFEKNIFAFFDFRISRAFIALGAYLTFVFLPFIGLLATQSTLFILSSITIVFFLINIAFINKELSIPIAYSLLYPLAALITLFIGVRSVLLCLWRQGITWGNIFIPLAQLKAFHRKNKR